MIYKLSFVYKFKKKQLIQVLKIIAIADYSDRTILWKKRKLNIKYWFAKLDGNTAFLRMNNFPDESLYTLISQNVIKDYDDLPQNWILE